MYHKKRRKKKVKSNIAKYHEILLEHAEDPESYIKSFQNLEDFNNMSFTQPKLSRKGTQFKFHGGEVKEVGKISHMLTVGGEPIREEGGDQKQTANFKRSNRFNMMIEGLSRKGIEIAEEDELEIEDLVQDYFLDFWTLNYFFLN